MGLPCATPEALVAPESRVVSRGFVPSERHAHLSTPAVTGTIQEDNCMSDDPRHRRRWLSTPLKCGIDQVTLAKFVECFPLPYK